MVGGAADGGTAHVRRVNRNGSVCGLRCSIVKAAGYDVRGVPPAICGKEPQPTTHDRSTTTAAGVVQLAHLSLHQRPPGHQIRRQVVALEPRPAAVESECAREDVATIPRYHIDQKPGVLL